MPPQAVIHITHQKTATQNEQPTGAMAAETLTLAKLVAELKKNRANITEGLTNSFKNFLSPIQTTLESVGLKVESYGSRLTDTETVLLDHSGRIVTPEAFVSEVKTDMLDLKTENNNIKDQLGDYENRARRSS